MLWPAFDASQIISKTIVNKIIIFQTVHSTSQYLIDNIFSLRCWDLCLAESQTHGRGKYGRYWLSPMNNNIYLSIYWCICSNNQLLIELSLMIGIVVGEVLRSFGVNDIEVKWPNDIYCQGRKLAGILVETVSKYNRYFHVIIGIGINVTTLDLRNRIILNNNCISLEEIGVNINRNALIIHIINRLYFLLDSLNFSLFVFLVICFR